MRPSSWARPHPIGRASFPLWGAVLLVFRGSYAIGGVAMNLRAAGSVGVVLIAGTGAFALSQGIGWLGMTRLLDGTNFDNFEQAGNANWRVGPGEQGGGSAVYAD